MTPNASPSHAPLGAFTARPDAVPAGPELPAGAILLPERFARSDANAVALLLEAMALQAEQPLAQRILLMGADTLREQLAQLALRPEPPALQLNRDQDGEVWLGVEGPHGVFTRVVANTAPVFCHTVSAARVARAMTGATQ